MNTLKKIFSVFLLFSFLLELIPVSVYADNDSCAALDAAAASAAEALVAANKAKEKAQEKADDAKKAADAAKEALLKILKETKDDLLKLGESALALSLIGMIKGTIILYFSSDKAEKGAATYKKAEKAATKATKAAADANKSAADAAAAAAAAACHALGGCNGGENPPPPPPPPPGDWGEIDTNIDVDQPRSYD
ncbi:MAG: hypothetical protein JZU72_00685 [Chlorobium phaeobacteroides]|jgi:hypothetical protein|nr:hypothetical protein [Chlorobium phaeobacteroides]